MCQRKFRDFSLLNFRFVRAEVGFNEMAARFDDLDLEKFVGDIGGIN